MTVLVRDIWVGTSTEKRLNIRFVPVLNRDEQGCLTKFVSGVPRYFQWVSSTVG